MSEKALGLADLVGEHVLTGCDMETFRDATAIRFALDGIVYQAEEDPDDGYRSALGTLAVVSVPIVNSFPAVKVLCRMQDRDDVLDVIDVLNGEIVLSVGTDDAADYYPSFVASFMPEKMAVNQAVPPPPAQEPTIK